MAMRRMGSGKTTSSGVGSGAGCMKALEARRGQGGSETARVGVDNQGADPHRESLSGAEIRGDRREHLPATGNAP